MLNSPFRNATRPFTDWSLTVLLIARQYNYHFEVSDSKIFIIPHHSWQKKLPTKAISTLDHGEWEIFKESNNYKNWHLIDSKDYSLIKKKNPQGKEKPE